MFLLVVSSYSKKRNGNIVRFHKAKLKSTLFAVKHLRLYNLPIIVLGYIWMPACLPIGKSITKTCLLKYMYTENFIAEK